MKLDQLREIFSRRRGAYRDTFERSVSGRKVLADLFHLCFAGRALPTRSGIGQPLSDFELGVAEGKRQVYLHIVSLIRANDEDLWRAAEDHSRELREVA